jgi:chaperonin cofactor prefoldin
MSLPLPIEQELSASSAMDKRLSQVEAKLDKLEAQVEEKLARLETRVDERLAKLETRVEERLDKLEALLTPLVAARSRGELPLINPANGLVGLENGK